MTEEIFKFQKIRRYESIPKFMIDNQKVMEIFLIKITRC